VTGVHYLGMSAVDVHMDVNGSDSVGVEVFSFLFPVFILSAVALALPIVAVLTTTPKDDEPTPVEQPQAHPLNAAAR
jgi:hypothetical protein